jgi:hypothetical protein
LTETSGTPKDAKAQAKADKAYKKASRRWFMKKRVWLIGVIGIIAISQVLSGGGGSDSESSNTSTEVTAEEPAIEVTAKTLIDDLEENALSAKTKYDGKKVIVTGELSNIDASGDYFSITGGDFTFTGVRIDIDEDLVATVSAFKKGQMVTVTGTVTDVGEILGYSIEAISIP